MVSIILQGSHSTKLRDCLGKAGKIFEEIPLAGSPFFFLNCFNGEITFFRDFVFSRVYPYSLHFHGRFLV